MNSWIHGLEDGPRSWSLDHRPHLPTAQAMPGDQIFPVSSWNDLFLSPHSIRPWETSEVLREENSKGFKLCSFSSAWSWGGVYTYPPIGIPLERLVHVFWLAEVSCFYARHPSSYCWQIAKQKHWVLAVCRKAGIHMFLLETDAGMP